MDAYVIALRLVHIIAGSFWVGATIMFVFFIEPTVKELGGPGQAVMGHLATKKRFPVVMGITSMLTVVAGVLLYWRVSGGFDSDWVRSGTGIGFTVGGISAIAAWGIGLFVTRPTVKRLAAAGARAARGEAPGEDMGALAQRLALAGRVALVLLIVAVAAMAIARYL